MIFEEHAAYCDANVVRTAYAAQANQLYNLILSKSDELPRALDRGFQYLLHTPVLALGKRVVEEVILAVAQRSGWDSLNDRLQLLKEVSWSLQERTPLRKRALDKESRPKLFNPIHIAADILAFMLTGEVPTVNAQKQVNSAHASTDEILLTQWLWFTITVPLQDAMRENGSLSHCSSSVLLLLQRSL